MERLTRLILVDKETKEVIFDFKEGVNEVIVRKDIEIKKVEKTEIKAIIVEEEIL